MARMSEDELNRLKQSVALSELCRSRGIELKPHGRKDLIGKCPFHEDRKPSFVVSPDKNLFHCMGCGAAGSVIDFLMKADGLNFKQAVGKLRQGLQDGAVKAETAQAAEKKTSVPPVAAQHIEVAPERATQLLERTITIYQKAFSEVPEGRAYLERRGITDAGLFTQHRIGYCNGRLSELLPKGNEVRKELRALGVLLAGAENGEGLSYRERFTGCVVFPIHDVDGNLTTLYGRFTGESQKRHVFLPDRPTGLWNAVAMKTYSEIILVESVIDGLSLMMAGQPNVIAIQGTNGLNDSEIFTFKQHGVQSVVLLFDGDDAGTRAIYTLRPRLEKAGLTVKVKALPATEDPNSYLVGNGAETLARFMASDAWTPNEMKYDTGHKDSIPEGQDIAADSNRARGETLSVPSGSSSMTERREAQPSAGPVAEHTGNGLRPGGGVHSLTVTYGLRKYRIMGLEKGPRKLKATIRVEHAGKLHVDTLDFYSAKSRRILAQDLCRLFVETPETIEADIDKLLRHCENLPEKAVTESGLQIAPSEPLMSATEKKDAESLGKASDIFARILADYEACGLVGEKGNKKLCYLAMTSRKMDDPLSVLILSSSGAGKTALQDTALLFCPPEDLVKLTSLSGKALFYKEQLSLRFKTLALEEGSGAEEASYAIRNLITARELVIESAIKDPATGKITTMTNKVEGPTSVFITTTDPDTDAETRSRFFVTSIDESREQTRAILSFQRQRHTFVGMADQSQSGDVLKTHRNFQRLLRPLKVVNRYADQLTYADDRLQGRRDQPKYLNLIKAVAFLRQMTKPVKTSPHGVEYLEVDRDDIAIANELANEILGTSLDELSAPGRDLLNHLDAMKKARKRPEGDGGEPACFLISRRDIREFTGWANARVHRYLKELLDFEYVVMDSGRNGLACRYRLLWDGQGKDGRRFVLGLKNVAELKEPDGNR